MKNVAVLVGSLRAASINRKFAEALAVLAKGKLNFEFVEIGDLPLYNEDLWENPPAAVTRMKAQVEAQDAVLLVTPEYNRSYTPALKNALDWGSRPYGASSWAGKPAAIAGTTPGATGTAAAQSELRGIAGVLGMVLMVQPEVYFQFKPELFDENGLTDTSAKEFLSGWVDAFAGFIDKLA